MLFIFIALALVFTSYLVSWHCHFVNILNRLSMFIIFLLIGIVGGHYIYIYSYFIVLSFQL
jgi:hypothetical protein